MNTNEPVVVVSNDTHIGPRLVEDLRPYCPAKHLDAFDRFVANDDVRVVSEDGELIRQLVIDPARDYQGRGVG